MGREGLIAPFFDIEVTRSLQQKIQNVLIHGTCDICPTVAATTPTSVFRFGDFPVGLGMVEIQKVHFSRECLGSGRAELSVRASFPVPRSI